MATADELSLALLLLRVVVGPVLAFHGFAKIFRGGRLDGTAGWFHSIGMRPGHVHARLAAAGELATGAALTLGLLTPAAGLGLVALMAVAFWTVHRGHGLLVFQDGWEYNLVLATIGAFLGLVGPGEHSLDHALGLDVAGTPASPSPSPVASPRPRACWPRPSAHPPPNPGPSPAPDGAGRLVGWRG